VRDKPFLFHFFDTNDERGGRRRFFFSPHSHVVIKKGKGVCVFGGNHSPVCLSTIQTAVGTQQETTKLLQILSSLAASNKVSQQTTTTATNKTSLHL
jgi:hypothetical protein